MISLRMLLSHAAWILLLIAATSASAVTGTAELQPASDREFAVDVIEQTWNDSDRNRKIPVRIYLARDLDTAQPVILMSPGLGSSREVYSYLGKYWASQGYVCLCMQHPGSDSSMITGNNPLQLLRLLRAAQNPDNWVNRALDVQFVLDELTRLNDSDNQFKGRIDTTRCGIAGHSYGGFTALTAAGLKLNIPDQPNVQLAEPRIKACMVMSPLPQVGSAFNEQSPAQLAVPCLYLCGTSDDERAVKTKAEERRFFFDNTQNSEAWLINIQGAAQYSFTETDSLKGDKYDRDPRHHRWIERISASFWNARLRGDEEAVRWLKGEGFQKLVGDEASLEYRAAK